MAPPVFDVVEHVLPASHIRDFARATARAQEEPLQLAVKQYVPRDQGPPGKGALTIVGAHANGFAKELYEPLWEDFYHECRRRGVRLRAIYIHDAAWQGKSGLLNQQKLGNDPGWNDYARDMAHMINTLRPPPPLAIGHSFGANALVNLSLAHPRLFIGLVLLDPIICRFEASPDWLRTGPAALSMRRRDTWPSRHAAAEAFRRSAFYRRWDARVLDRWIEHSVRDADDGTVTLTTPREQEVYTYLRPSWPAFDAGGKELLHPDLVPDLDRTRSTGVWPLYRAECANIMSLLPHVRPSVLYILGESSDTPPPGPQRVKRTSTTGVGFSGSGGLAAGRVREVSHPDHGHLIPMEAPTFCAVKAAAWAEAEMARWRAAEAEYEAWARKPQEKMALSEEFKQFMRFSGTELGKEKAKL